MPIKEHTEENSNQLVLVKVAAWNWSEQTTVSEINYTGSCDIVVGSSRYKQEAMNEAHEDHTRVSTRHINNPLFSTISTDSSLLDKYEIERISKDIERYLQFSCDKYYCGKSVDGVHVAGSRRIVPLMEKDSRGTKAKRTNTQRKWCRPMYELCGSIKGDVVENVCLATERRRQANKKHIPMAGDWNFHRNGA